MMKPLFAVLAIASLASTAQAATPVAAAPSASGKQAIECFAVYKMAGDAPQNAAHKDDLTHFQSLMQWSMQKSGVTQKQFTSTLDGFMGGLRKMGPVDGQKFMDGKIDSCNTFAKAQYDAYNKEKAAAKSGGK